MRRFAVILVLVVIAGCTSEDDPTVATPSPTTSSTTSTVPTDACSAAVLSNTRTDDQPELPAEVAATRAAILEAALACDYDGLEELALAGDGTFSYTFGGDQPGGVSEHWRAREAEGEEVLRILVETLRLPFVHDGDTFAWPSAHQERPDDADWDALRGLYSEAEVASWRSGGSGFLGYRAGITEEGDWRYFIAGD